MKTGEAIRDVMKIQSITVTQMAKDLNKSTRLISERLGQENISIAKINEMLEKLNYKTVIVPIDTPLPENSYVIE
ncbi:MAG: hypothetical protein KH972_02630 [Peptostreptococcaceae bacterium]|nr:hypothetical protein [Peptostreptococcaceae bacterium]